MYVPYCNSTFLDGGVDFGQIQPPLTDDIKAILDEYPDGQIFNVSAVINYTIWLNVVIILCVINRNSKLLSTLF